MIPSQFIFALPASNASSLATSQSATNSIALNVTTVLSSATWIQRRVVINSLGTESSNAFNIVGFNAAGSRISELLPGVANTGNLTSVLDYASLLSITVQNVTSGISTASASSITVGMSPTGSSLWQIVSNMMTPVNIELSGVPIPAVGTTITNTATWAIQYTYDDPNTINTTILNQLATTTYQPQPFTHATLSGTTLALDGAINDPIFAWRLLITSGTGTIKCTGIQAGIAGP